MKVLQSSEHQQVSLDVYDRKLLFALAQNCRLPYSYIAKQVGLSRDAVRYRLHRLQEQGVVQGFRTLVDIDRLGFLNVHLFLQLNQPGVEVERTLVETFKAYSFVRAIIKFSGKYDFELAIVARDMKDCERIISTIVTDCGDSLQDYTLLFITKPLIGKTFPDNFLKTPASVSKTDYSVPDLDAKDYALLRVIADHGDMPLHVIAQKLGVAPDTVKYRIKNLRQSGVIKGFVPVINYHLINYTVYAILLNIAGLADKREATLHEFLRTNKDVLWAVKTIGKYNVVLYVCTTQPDDLMKTTAELRSFFTGTVKDYETLINYEEYKYTYYPEIQQE